MDKTGKTAYHTRELRHISLHSLGHVQTNAEGAVPSQLSNHACHQARHGGQTVWPNVQHIRSRRYTATNQEGFQTGIGVQADCDLHLDELQCNNQRSKNAERRP